MKRNFYQVAYGIKIKERLGEATISFRIQQPNCKISAREMVGRWPCWVCAVLIMLKPRPKCVDYARTVRSTANVINKENPARFA
jgi:hypothetical protein